jgi:hypothetical protein
MNRSLIVAALLAATLVVPGATARGQFRTVALSGQASPGLGSPFTFFESPLLNDLGKVAFVAHASANTGVWSEGSGLLSGVAFSGATAPGSVTFTDFKRLVLNNAGQLAIEATYSGGGPQYPTGFGFWTASAANAVSLVARQGSLAPGYPSGGVITALLNSLDGYTAPPVLNDAGQVVFRALMSSGEQGLFSNISGGLAPLIATNDPATGVANGVNYNGIGEPLLNNPGQVTFTGFLAPNGIVHGPRLIDPNGTVTPIVSTSDGFNNLIAPAKLNDDGDTAFWGFSNINGMSVWRQPHGQPRGLIVAVGQQAPGTAPGIQFDHLTQPILNAQDRIALGAYLAGSGVTAQNDYGVWSERPSGLTLVAREGNPAPGTSLVFKAIEDTVVFNQYGQVAFSALAGTPSGFGDSIGIWATDAAGNLQRIAFPGMVIDVDNGPGFDIRTISSVASLGGERGGTGNQDGLGSAFNELGHVAFAATFTDGTGGVFVSRAVHIPEPAAALLAIAALATLPRRRSRG